MKSAKTPLTVLFIWLALAAPRGVTAQTWMRTYPDSFFTATDVVEMSNGDFLLAVNGYNQSSPSYDLIRTDLQGNMIGQYESDNSTLKHIFNLFLLPDDGVLTWGKSASGRSAVGRFSAAGALLWVKIFTVGDDTLHINAVEKSGDGNFFISGAGYPSWSNPGSRLLKIDPDGNELWSFTGGPLPNTWYDMAVCPMPDGGASLLTEAYGSSTPRLSRLDANGNVLWSKPFDGPVFGQNFWLFFQPGLGYTILTSGWHNLIQYGFDEAGNLLWSKNTGMNLVGGSHLYLTDFVPEANGFFTGTGSYTSSAADTLEQTVLLKIDDAGNWTSLKVFPPAEEPVGHAGHAIIQTSDQGYAIAGKLYTLFGPTPDSLSEMPLAMLLRTDHAGVLYQVSGQVYIDADEDCQLDGGEAGFPMVPVVLSSPGGSYLGLTDPDGHYAIEADTGSFSLNIGSPSAGWLMCPQGPVVITPDVGQVTADIGMPPATACAELEIHLGGSLFRPCVPDQINVYYTNTGTIPVDTAYILIELPDSLIFLGSSIPLTSQDGQQLRFDLPPVSPGLNSHFTIQTQTACGQVLGQTLCVEGEIFPQSLCDPVDPLWNGANIEVEGWCDGDSVYFRIRNTGTGDVLLPLNFIVIEDQIMNRNGEFQLPAGVDTILVFAASGWTQLLFADQAPGHPGLDQPSVAVEGCNGPVETGFINLYPQNEADPFVSIYCAEVQASFDPNDKQGFPLGIGDDHRIPRRQALDYVLRFQNTGNDTAFNVVLRDTLSDLLDILTFRPGASSHAYTVQLRTAPDGRPVLSFTFANILMPDTATNEAASHGFVQFRIEQQPDLPDGTEILNRAGIYFDYNTVVLTNTTQHTIGEDDWINLINPTDEPGDANDRIQVRIAPNPMANEAYISVEGWEDEFLKLLLFDAQGRLIADLTGEGKVAVQRGSLPAGMYFFQLKGKAVVSGKLMMR